MKYVIIILTTGILSLGLGYYLGTGNVETVVIEKELVREGQTKTEYKDRIITVVKEMKPDGTVTETTKTEEKEGSKETTKKVVQRDTDTTTEVLPDYSVGAKYWASYENLLKDVSNFQVRNIEVEAGYRVIGNVWVEGGARTDSAAIGIRVDF